MAPFLFPKRGKDTGDMVQCYGFKEFEELKI